MRQLSVFMLCLCLGLTLSACRGGFHPDLQDLRSHVSNHNIDSAAHWAGENIIILPKNTSADYVRLLGFPDGLQGTAKPSAFQLSPALLSDVFKAKLPEGADFQAYEIKAKPDELKALLKGEVMIGLWDGKDLIAMHYVQAAQALDVFYTASSNDADEQMDYGAQIDGASIRFALWAPTAQSIRLKTYTPDFIPAEDIPMDRDAMTGVWRAAIKQIGAAIYYRYEMTIFHPASRRVETYEVTDPYSLALSANGEYSMVADLDDPALKPPGWDTPHALADDLDHITYGVHVKTFSPAGNYGAFTQIDSAPMQYLDQLVKAGVSTVHLMPVYDFGAVNEIAFERINADSEIGDICAVMPEPAEFCRDPEVDKNITLADLLSNYDQLPETAQSAIRSLAHIDDYDPGYNPVHYSVPDGAYADNPDGTARTLEFRRLVQSLHRLGLRVTMDVNYDLARSAGLETHSVLDKIVPGYYIKRDPVTGHAVTESGVTKTALDRIMMTKLKTDSLRVWAKDYKIDGFQYSREPVEAAENVVQGPQTDNPSYRARLQAQALGKSLLMAETPFLQMGDEFLAPAASSSPSLWPREINLSKPGDHDAFISKALKDFINIRRSSALLTLRAPEELASRRQVRIVEPGVSVITLDDGYMAEAHENIDPNVSQIVVITNETATRKNVAIDNAARLRLHPALINGADLTVKQTQILIRSVSVPPHTTAVLIRPE